MKRLLLLFTLLLTVLFTDAKNRKIRISTPYGVMIIKLYDQTPKHRDNFIKLTRRHFYDSTLFHRVIRNFMIQGGDPDSKHAAKGALLGEGDVGYTIPAEFQLDLFHRKGALAAARDNRPDKASSGCQFYIVQGKMFTDAQLDTLERTRLGGRKIPVDQREIYKTIGGAPHLDQSYTVFGQVIKGMEVIDKIAAVQTDKNNRPVTDVPMKIRLIRKWLFF
ncbi:peptidyl-prolyl cis-trans isomerase B (cyclophilin B) [Chitinophaga terrae (ex Kim and Jung 2007)]|uniref:Peptidyl-prolyl cis-trans isomerase n=1 Tax=Chitinophaga terrae (ex Kim and Jung 2007) TaxID=408074 RepID=A0A1H4FAK2_9BACT|nr:peptidylprolyl isomerase [Chitinophaga terrae (ex Kim and Jung 2007)]GEP92322.1 peptidyl-prolyl cis-trans isomerase [Chitinophaga terrae (ex Kim and Jung 2007)]SEA93502.1 peptidyl-prolyl cis-trans isomerase B (cyclophilin B) [Chitinophaga terrae (ex Kim and Jung 2007)]